MDRVANVARRSPAGTRDPTGPGVGGWDSGFGQGHWEDDPFMMHVTCDGCHKELFPGEEYHFVVKIEVFAAPAAPELT